MKFYKCQHCGNIVMFLQNSGVAPICCGESLTELTANTTDAATEKHVPMVQKNGNHIKITVGSVAHPMIAAHYVQWIVLETKLGYQCRFLKPEETPFAEFVLSEGDEAVRVYEYCNLHGLWSADI